MSVLVQRPHQVPSLIMLQRQHNPHPHPKPSPKLNNSPVPRRQQQQRVQQPQQQSAAQLQSQPQQRTSKRRSHQPAPPSTPPTTPPLSTVSSLKQPTTPIRKNQQARTALPSNATATTVTPASTVPTTPPTKNQRSSSRHTPKLPDEDSPAPGFPPSPSPAAKRARRNVATSGVTAIPVTQVFPQASPTFSPAQPPAPGPNTWQQAALIKKQAPATPVMDHLSPSYFSLPKSAPTSPARLTPPYRDPAPVIVPILSHSHTMPNFSHSPFNAQFGPNPSFRATPPAARRPSSHQRAPSYPIFPMHREEDMFTAPIPTAQQPNGHQRGVSVSASLPGPVGIHGRMNDSNTGSTRRQRTFTGAPFAGASFQHAPDAMTMSKPPFSSSPALMMMFGGRAVKTPEVSESDESDDHVIDLGDDDEDSDESDEAFML